MKAQFVIHKEYCQQALKIELRAIGEVIWNTTTINVVRDFGLWTCIYLLYFPDKISVQKNCICQHTPTKIVKENEKYRKCP